MPTKTETIGRVLFEAGDYETALLEAEQDSDPVLRGLKKASIYFERYQFAESLSSLRAIVEIEGASPRLKARFYAQRAAVYVKIGSDDKALIDYEAGRHWAKKAEDPLCEASIRNNLSRMYSKQGDLNKALSEVDFAIKTAIQIDQQLWLGRFMDQKAQILLDHERYSEALNVSRKAVQIAELHGNERTLSEAQVTHGKAWILLGTSSLEVPSAFRIRRELSSELNPSLDKELIELALKNSNGRVSLAADYLGLSHVAMIKAIEKFNLTRQPKRHRARSLTLKK